jgi:hypothetical protein
MKVFLSSTCYDLADLRARLEQYLTQNGHQPLLSDRPDFPVSPGKHRHDVCVEVASSADLLILVIASRFGAPYHQDPTISVTWAEYRAAAANGVKTLAFVRSSVFDERKTWKKNDGKLNPSHCDDARIYQLIDEIQANSGVWNQPFKDVEEIVRLLDQATDGNGKPLLAAKRPASHLRRRRLPFFAPIIVLGVLALVLFVLPELWRASHPDARLSPNSTHREIEKATANMGVELRAWEDLKSPLEREAMLEFTDRFVKCPQQFISDHIESPTAGGSFGLEMRRGRWGRPVVLRDVVVEVLKFHAVAPSCMPGLGFEKKPVLAVELRNRGVPLPWEFHVGWVSETGEPPYSRFEEQQVFITKSEWEAFRLKLSSRNRGVYELNITVVLQQGDDAARAILLTPKPVKIAFFEFVTKEHPDFEMLRQRFMEKGGLLQAWP